MSLDLTSLNTEQLDAVTSAEGPVLVLAGAGSGKTRVLTYRIAYILQERLAQPENILAVTFTNKAAGEMKHRIADLLGEERPLPWMGTFHAICVKILRKEGSVFGIGSNFSIYDSNDQQDVVKQAMERLNLSIKDFNPRAVHGMISSAKNELVDSAQYEQFAQGYFQEKVAEIYPVYQEILRENNALDFDDLLMYAVVLFKKNADVLERYRALFKFILVDEYQDTNHAQYVLVNMLADKHKNICVVGDDDQSIYSFRGANIRNILSFEKDYPEAKVIKLEQNYRSSELILSAAHQVVSRNKERTSKKLWTAAEGGEKIVLYTAVDERDEARWVVARILEVTKSGQSPENIAILYRTNAQSRTLEEEFLRQAVNYRVVGGVRFYERKEVKDILAYLQVLYNPSNHNALRRIINVPRRGIGDKALEEVIAGNGEVSGLAYILKTEVIASKAVASFSLLMNDILAKSHELNIVELINFIIERTGYIDMLQDGTTENEARIENIKELVSVAAKHAALPPRDGLASFLEEVSLLEGSAIDDNSEAVTLMTIHAAKGLEYEHVFVVGMEEGLFPHSRVYTDPKELEEERRLAYVAITRAKRNLYFVRASSRLYFGSRQSNLPSRFVEEIEADLIESIQNGRSSNDDDWEIVDSSLPEWQQEVKQLDLVVGDKVEHEYFGRGRVAGVNEAVVKIDFGPVYGVKELVIELAPIRKIE